VKRFPNAETIDRACNKEPDVNRILILNSPNNPTGLCLSHSKLQEISDVCRKYGVIVVSDEIYSHLQFAGECSSIANYYPEGTIISSSLSKWCGAGGWRLGYMAFPKQLEVFLPAMDSLASESYSSVGYSHLVFSDIIPLN
jgi:aspartate aminotransferase